MNCNRYPCPESWYFLIESNKLAANCPPIIIFALCSVRRTPQSPYNNIIASISTLGSPSLGIMAFHSLPPTQVLSSSNKDYLFTFKGVPTSLPLLHPSHPPLVYSICWPSSMCDNRFACAINWWHVSLRSIDRSLKKYDRPGHPESQSLTNDNNNLLVRPLSIAHQSVTLGEFQRVVAA